MKDTIKEVLIKKAKENRISCKSALDIAEELNVSPREIGTEADLLKIKIIECQLGCFGTEKKGK